MKTWVKLITFGYKVDIDPSTLHGVHPHCTVCTVFQQFKRFNWKYFDERCLTIEIIVPGRHAY